MKLPLLMALLWLAAAAAAECVPFDHMEKKAGDAACVTGTVLKVGQSHAGNWFLDFCVDYRHCPFSVFIYEKDAEKLGDLRRLQGQQVTIYGRLRDYNGRTEIILRDKRQLEGEKTKYLPQEDEPKGMARNRDFDASMHGPRHHPLHSAQHGSHKPATHSSAGTASSADATNPKN
jgi:hypothetical protein